MNTYLSYKYLAAKIAQTDISNLDFNRLIPIAAVIILATMVVYLINFRK